MTKATMTTAAAGGERWPKAALAGAGQREEEPLEVDTKCSLLDKVSVLALPTDTWPQGKAEADSSTGSSDTGSA